MICKLNAYEQCSNYKTNTMKMFYDQQMMKFNKNLNYHVLLWYFNIFQILIKKSGRISQQCIFNKSLNSMESLIEILMSSTTYLF